MLSSRSRRYTSIFICHDAATRFWKTHKDLALLKEFLGDRDTESVMRYVNIDGKEASRLMRKRRPA
jgi:hypothetical protein